MSDQEVRAIAEMMSPLVIQGLIDRGVFHPPVDAVVDRDEAMRLAKKRSLSAFYRWDAKFGPCGCGKGRFNPARIRRALEKESKQ